MNTTFKRISMETTENLYNDAYINRYNNLTSKSFDEMITREQKQQKLIIMFFSMRKRECGRIEGNISEAKKIT